MTTSNPVIPPASSVQSADSFMFVVKRIADESPDLSWLGEYSNHWQAGAIERPNWQSNREYQYFIPAQTEQDQYDSLRACINVKDSRKRNYGVKTARRLAREYVARDFERMESYGESWAMIGVVVSLEFNHRKIGSASLWGIESDSDESYFLEVIADLKSEARADAQLFLAGISAQTVPNVDLIETLDR